MRRRSRSDCSSRRKENRRESACDINEKVVVHEVVEHTRQTLLSEAV